MNGAPSPACAAEVRRPKEPDPRAGWTAIVPRVRGRRQQCSRYGPAEAQPSSDVVVAARARSAMDGPCLREMGVRALVDAYGGQLAGQLRGETRQIRAGYGTAAVPRWVLEAFGRWKAREAEWGRRLLFETGRLLLAPEWNHGLETTKAALDKYHVPNERLSQSELRRRYPQMNAEGVGVALFEPTTGVLKAREGCMAVAEAFQKKGGHFRISRAALGRRAGARLTDVALTDGTSVAASTFVFACGPWLGKVFPDVMKGKLFTPRRDVFFFGTPAGDDRFSYPNFPNYSEDDSLGYYGFPSIDNRGFKVCPVGEKTAFDPDTDERMVSAYQVKRARTTSPCASPPSRTSRSWSRGCRQLEMSVDEHFIVDRHPALENVWLVGGGSGHGYKHGPVMGDYVARRVMGQDKSPELETVFRLKAQTFSGGAS